MSHTYRMNRTESQLQASKNRVEMINERNGWLTIIILCKPVGGRVNSYDLKYMTKHLHNTVIRKFIVIRWPIFILNYVNICQ